MTSDLETAQEDGDPADWRQPVRFVTDQAISDRTTIGLETVRRWLEEFDGSRFVVGRDGETLTVESPVTRT